MVFSPEVGGSSILCVSQTGNGYVYDLSGNISNARKPILLGSQPAVKPTSVGKKFVVATANGAVALIDPSTGSTDWKYYVRPMNEAARTASSGSNGPAGPSGGGAAGGAAGGSGFGGGAGQGGKSGGGGGTTTSEPIVTVEVSAPIALAGKTLLVPAADASLLAFDVDSGVDLTGPIVKQVWPTAGEIVSGKNGQEFIFKIEDDTSGVNISSIKFDIDGTAYNFDFGREGYLISLISQTKKNNMVSTGRHTLHVTATDWMGNVTNYTGTIRIDNTLEPLKRPGSDTTKNPAGGGGKGSGGFGGGGSGAGAG
jgi:uncharacterized membrane protein YgcG